MTSRLYSARWRKARATFLRRNPFCRMCSERGTLALAEVVDHVVPHRGDVAKFWDTGNWQPLCKLCHDGPKQAEERSGRRRGVDADGTPIDPEHLWNR